MKKVLFAMLVSGMLFSCTNNSQTEEQPAADSTAQVSATVVEPVETEEVEVDTTNAEVIETEATETSNQ